jgi:AcrR family transcriptional regulator
MTRPRGSQNARHPEKRLELLRHVRKSLTVTGNDKLTFSELAESAGVSIPTLRHYFGTRSKLIAEVFEEVNKEGQRHMLAASKPVLPFPESVMQAAEEIMAGVRYGRMDKIHTLGLTEGLGDGELGPAYLQQILEPGLQSLEARFLVHQERGDMVSCSVRYAAIDFAAPLLVANLHQRGLGGSSVRPMEMHEFVRSHVSMFIRAYSPETKKGR